MRQLPEPPIVAVRTILDYLGEKPRAGMEETPKRFLKALVEMTSGYDEDPAEHLKKEFDLNDTDDTKHIYDGIIISGDINFVSMCEHHMLPFEGVIHIGYLPNKDNSESKVVGLSKLARMAEGFAKRFQVQERLTQQIADTIQSVLSPAGVGVIVRGRHTCQCYRGIKKDGFMVTSSMTGLFRQEAETRNEFLKLIELGKA